MQQVDSGQWTTDGEEIKYPTRTWPRTLLGRLCGDSLVASLASGDGLGWCAPVAAVW